MARIEYKTTRFKPESLAIIERINEIVSIYQADGLKLTLRQVYYQFVSRDWLANNDKNYNMLGGVLVNARLAGMVDWDAIEDRGRNIKKNSHWDSPVEIVNAVANQYQIDKWADQRYRPEVFVEKDALVGVIERACRPLDVSFLSCRGYASQTALHDTALRFQEYIDEGQKPIIFHLGDHDPSGIDMSRDIQEKMDLFLGSGAVEVRRIALTRAQIRQYDPPPNPAKMTDSRAAGYVRQHGNQSWELDALEPRILVDLITRNVTGVREVDKWNAKVEQQNRERRHLQTVADNWTNIETHIEENGLTPMTKEERAAEKARLEQEEEEREAARPKCGFCNRRLKDDEIEDGVCERCMREQEEEDE